MTFRTEKERNKWDTLQKMGSVTIDKIVAGKAQPEDIKALSTLVARQYEGASKLFDEGIAGVEATADSLIDKMNKERIALGKAPLTAKAQDRLFKQTFQKVLSASATDILGSVKDYMDEKFSEQDDVNKEVIADAFDRVRKLASSTNESSTFNVWRKTPNAPTKSQSSVAEKLDSLFGTITKIYAKVPDSNKSVTRLIKTLGSEQATSDETAKAPVMNKLRDLFQKRKSTPTDAAQSIQDVMKSYGVKSNKEVKTSIIERNKTNSTLASQTPLDTQIKSSLVANNALRIKAKTHWDGLQTTRDADADDEEKNSNSWLRKIKAMFGSGSKKDRASIFSGKGDLVGTLGKVLIMSLMSPELIGTITKTVGQYLNFDSITTFVGETWKSIKSAGANTVDWVINKVKDFFGIGNKQSSGTKLAAPINKKISTDTTAGQRDSTVGEKKIVLAKSNLALAQAADQANSTPATKNAVTNRLTELQRTLAQYSNNLSTQASPSGAAPSSITSLLGSSTNSSKVGTATPTATGSVATGTSSATIMANSSAATRVVSESPARYKEDGFVGPTATDEQSKIDSKNIGVAASMPVSISSFGFNSGDDTLNLLNMGLISA